jgi:2-iminoacetate synthase
MKQVREIAELSSRPGALPVATAAAWARTKDPDVDAALADTAGRLTQERFGPAVLLFAPLYLSNLCVNNCLYCGFRRENREVPRRVLTIEEITEEARRVLAMGHRRVLMVAAENPSVQGQRWLVEAAQALRGMREGSARIEHLGAEVAPGAPGLFQALVNAGVDAYVLFQETYDRAIYARVHPDAGVRDVGMGILLGLRDPVDEMVDLITHAREIEERTGRPPRTVSLPRMRPAEGSVMSEHPPRPVTDAELLRMISVLRLALPSTGIILSSREPAELRDRALACGVTEMSAGSRTDPGGYAHPEHAALAQFDLEDRRSLEEVAAGIRACGRVPVVSAEDAAATGIRP